MSSSYLLNLKINALQEEINGIGNAVGYFFNVTSPNGLTIDGGDTAVSIAAPSENNTMYCYSNVARSGAFQASAESGKTYASTVMFYGISKDVSQVFPNASSPSMAMCDWGILVDNQVSTTEPATVTFLIQNGVRTEQTEFDGSNFSQTQFTYDGTTLKFFIDGTEIPTYRQTVELAGGYFLVAGSFYGGELNKITWTGVGGTSGGGGSNDNLQMILANGNDAGNQDILGVDSLTCKTLNYTTLNPPITESQNLNSVLQAGNDAGNQDMVNIRNLNLNSYLQIGNAVDNTSQIHLAYDSGNTTTGRNWQIVASTPSDPTIDFQSYLNNALVKTPFTINESQIIARNEFLTTSSNDINSGRDVLAFRSLSCAADAQSASYYQIVADKTNNLLNIQLEPSQGSPVIMLSMNPVTASFEIGGGTADQTNIPNVSLVGKINNSPFKSRVLDSFVITPSTYLTSNTTNGSFSFSGGTSVTKTLYTFDLKGLGYDAIYNNFTMYISSVSFDSQIVNYAGFNDNIQFFLSNTLNAPFSTEYPLNVSKTIPLPGGTGTNPISQAGWILSGIFDASLDQLYLNATVGLNSTETVNITSLNIQAYTEASIMPVLSIEPT